VDRREFLKKSALTGAGLALAPVLKLAPLARNLSHAPSDIETAQCLWGAFAEPQGQQKAMDALLALEQMVGRQMAVHRNYQGMDKDILDKAAQWLSQRGTIPYRSFHAWTGSQRYAIQWADIAAGKYDAWLSRQAAALAAWGQKMYICFHHEPEDDTTGNPQSQTYNHVGCGSSTDFLNAYNHVRAVFGNATNLTWLVTLLSPTFLGRNGGTDAWMPVSLDVVGVDGYNRYPCSGPVYKSFTDKFAPARTYAISRGKPLAIPEWGCVEQNACNHPEGDPLGKATWFTDAGNVAKTWPELIFLSYSHEIDYGMNFRVDSSAVSLSAFTAVGHDPYFN